MTYKGTRNPMYPIVLSVEVQNSFEYPNQAQLLAEELQDIAARIEDTTDFSEEDVFLAGVFEGGMELQRDNLDLYTKWLGELSRDFPDLVFSVDVDEPDDELEEAETVERWYIRDGRRQVAEPYMVIPDFDPDQAGEEI